MLLLIGVLESSYLLVRSIDIATAAREAGRLASDNHGDLTAIKVGACLSMDYPAGASINLTGSGNGLGGTINATASQSVATLTGLLDTIFSPPINLSRSAFFRLEAPTATWTDGSGSC
ncbi:MAG: hypothetical protein LC739_05110 [Actinobacteria bacterium]|nr:hypothetical protein [Actinomycetota bacterium]